MWYSDSSAQKTWKKICIIIFLIIFKEFKISIFKEILKSKYGLDRGNILLKYAMFGVIRYDLGHRSLL